MKKKGKKVLHILIMVAIVIAIDCAQVMIFKSKPIFSLEYEVPYGRVYKSFFVDVYYCENNKEIVNVHIESKSSKFTCPVYEAKKEFEIMDETTTCPQALELFYEDKYYKYYFKCEKSETVFIKFQSDIKMTVKEALKRELVTISELEKEGLDFYKEAK